MNDRDLNRRNLQNLARGTASLFVALGLGLFGPVGCEDGAESRGETDGGEPTGGTLGDTGDDGGEDGAFGQPPPGNGADPGGGDQPVLPPPTTPTDPSPGADCSLGEVHCDADDRRVYRCIAGKLQTTGSCDRFGEYCREGFGCQCEEGTVSCPDDRRKQECYATSSEGATAYGAPETCAPGTLCEEGVGCVTKTSICPYMGEMRCRNGTTVERCQMDPSGVKTWQPALDCYGAGLSHCGEWGPTSPQAPIDLCVNTCGGYGIPLEYEPFDTVPGLGCAYFVCDDDGGVIPTHSDCRSPGQPCDSDDQCAHMNCKSDQLCGGPTGETP